MYSGTLRRERISVLKNKHKTLHVVLDVDIVHTRMTAEFAVRTVQRLSIVV